MFLGNFQKLKRINDNNMFFTQITINHSQISINNLLFNNNL